MIWNVMEGGRDFDEGKKRCLFAGVLASRDNKRQS